MVRAFLDRVGIQIVAITDKDCETAVKAFSTYGKTSGHPAKLNLGDCFAYAMAKNHRRPLLFKGNDVVRTDIRAAVRAR